MKHRPLCDWALLLVEIRKSDMDGEKKPEGSPLNRFARRDLNDIVVVESGTSLKRKRKQHGAVRMIEMDATVEFLTLVN